MVKEQEVSDRFGAVARSYDRHAAVQQEVARRLLERLDGLSFQPKRVLDLGCGTGEQARAIVARFSDAEVIALDASRPMLDMAARRRGRWRRRFELVAGDAASIPLAEASIDLLFSSMTLEWTADWRETLTALRRILRPGGMVLMATIGPDTLRELGSTGIDIGNPIDAQGLGDALVRAGFQEPVIDTDWLTTTHERPESLIDDLRASGFGLDRQTMSAIPELQGATGSSSLVTTWEIVYASAWAPEEGQPVRTPAGEEASVSISSVGRRRRN